MSKPTRRADQVRVLARPRYQTAWVSAQQPNRARWSAPVREFAPVTLPDEWVKDLVRASTIDVMLDSSLDSRPASDLPNVPVSDLEPIRGIQHHNRALNSPSILLMSKVDVVLWVESRLEAMVATQVDFLGQYSAIAAQPLRINFGALGSHVPDFVVRRSDGRLILIDCRSSERLDARAHRQALLTSAVCREVGVEYVLHQGFSARELGNLRLMRYFRSRPRFWGQVSPMIRSLAPNLQTTWGALESELTESFGIDAAWIRPVVGHAAWTGLARINLRHRLNARTKMVISPSLEEQVQR